MKAVLGVCTIALLSLAGCLSEDNGAPSVTTSATTNSSNGPTSSKPPVVVLPQPTSLPKEARSTDCTGFYTGQIFPRGTNPNDPPASWSEDATEVTTRVFMWLLECHRFSWGDIERGPVRMMLEYANEKLPPEKCLDSEAPSPWHLTAWWIDDQEIVDRLADLEGLPMQFATFEHSEDFAETSSSTWAWAGQGSESSLQAVQAGPQSGDGLPDARLIWAPGNRASFVDMSFAYKAQGPIDGLVTGTLAEELLLGQVANGLFAGSVLIVTEVNITGNIQRFADATCEQPLS